MIETYIKEKPGFENEVVEIKQLNFENKKGDLKSFLVKVPIKRKDELYKSEFWPENVVIKRFNLQVYKKTCAEADFL